MGRMQAGCVPVPAVHPQVPGKARRGGNRGQPHQLAGDVPERGLEVRPNGRIHSGEPHCGGRAREGRRATQPHHVPGRVRGDREGEASLEIIARVASRLCSATRCILTTPYERTFDAWQSSRGSIWAGFNNLQVHHPCLINREPRANVPLHLIQYKGKTGCQPKHPDQQTPRYRHHQSAGQCKNRHDGDIGR